MSPLKHQANFNLDYSHWRISTPKASPKKIPYRSLTASAKTPKPYLIIFHPPHSDADHPPASTTPLRERSTRLSAGEREEKQGLDIFDMKQRALEAEKAALRQEIAGCDTEMDGVKQSLAECAQIGGDKWPLLDEEFRLERQQAALCLKDSNIDYRILKLRIEKLIQNIRSHSLNQCLRRDELTYNQ